MAAGAGDGCAWRPSGSRKAAAPVAPLDGRGGLSSGGHRPAPAPAAPRGVPGVDVPIMHSKATAVSSLTNCWRADVDSWGELAVPKLFTVTYVTRPSGWQRPEALAVLNPQHDACLVTHLL